MEEGVDVLSESSGSLSGLRRELDEYRLGKTAENVEVMEEGEEEEPAPSEPAGFGSPLRSAPEQMEAAAVPEYEEDAIRCVCESVDDDGFTIQCDGCLVWQHAVCVGISKDGVPERYFCELCKPELHQKDGYWVGASFGAVRKVARKPSFAVHPARLNFAEIGASVVSREVAPGFAYLARQFYEATLAQMPQPPFGSPEWGRVNFEFIPGLVALPGPEALRRALKAVEIREIRGRGAAKRSVTGPSGAPATLRLGVFALQDVDPGCLVLEYTGSVQTAALLGLPKRPERVLQSHVLFVPGLAPPICVDARRQGNAARHIRRSCRPNCGVKLVLSGGADSSNVHVCLFARNAVPEGDELLLPIDLAEGSAACFRYECACGSPEYCLAPEGAQPQPRPRTAAASYDAAAMVDSTHILRPAGAAQAQTQQQQQQLRAKTPTAAAPLVSALAAGAPPAKLTREERKMLQYIEQIDRMDTAGKRSASRKSSSGMASSASVAAIGGGGGSPSAKTSPARQARDASPSSPRKRRSEADSVPDEDTGMDMDKDDMDMGVDDAEAGNTTVTEPLQDEGPSPVKKVTKAPKPPKTEEPKKAKEKTAEGKKATGEPKKGKKAKKALEVPPESIPEEMPEGSSSSRPASRPSSPRPVSVRKPLFARLDQVFPDDEAMLVDVVRSDERAPPALAHAASGTPPPRPDTAEGSPGGGGSGSERETPSKKRVSLSDYMKKRRATDPCAREEGELPPVPPPSERRGTTVERPTFLDDDHHQHPRHHPRPTSSAGRFYEMPPHLTPPPPLATHSLSAMELKGPSGNGGEPYAVPPRSESATHHHEEHGGGGRFDRGDMRHPERREQHAAARYGYAAAGREYPRPQDPPPPTQQQQQQQQQQQLYRPRPSLIKAAQDLPTRWEEQAARDPYRPQQDRYKRDFEPRRSYPASGYESSRHPEDYPPLLPPGLPRDGLPPPPYGPDQHRKPPPHHHHQPHWKRPGGGGGGGSSRQGGGGYPPQQPPRHS